MDWGHSADAGPTNCTLSPTYYSINARSVWSLVGEKSLDENQGRHCEILHSFKKGDD